MKQYRLQLQAAYHWPVRSDASKRICQSSYRFAWWRRCCLVSPRLPRSLRYFSLSPPCRERPPCRLCRVCRCLALVRSNTTRHLRQQQFTGIIHGRGMPLTPRSFLAAQEHGQEASIISAVPTACLYLHFPSYLGAWLTRHPLALQQTPDHLPLKICLGADRSHCKSNVRLGPSSITRRQLPLAASVPSQPKPKTRHTCCMRLRGETLPQILHRPFIDLSKRSRHFSLAFYLFASLCTAYP